MEKEMATHSSTLAWKIPWTEEPGRLHAVHGVAKSRTWLSDFTFTSHFHALEKEMATHSSVLAWRIPGMGKPGGLPSMGLHRVGHDWSDLAAAAAAGLHSRAQEWSTWLLNTYYVPSTQHTRPHSLVTAAPEVVSSLLFYRWGHGGWEHELVWGRLFSYLVKHSG